MTTKLPSIPSFDGSNTGEVLGAIKEALEVRVGVRGNALDAGVTFRDLETLGFVEQSETASTLGDLSSRVNLRTTFLTGDRSTVYDPAADLSTPPAPTDLKATAVFETVFLSWSQSAFPNQSFWEIWRSFTNELSSAALVGTSASQFFTDIVGEDRTVYYWVRTVSAAGIKSAWNSSFGTEVKTGIDPAKLIKAIEGEILESSLSKELASRITDTNEQARINVKRITAEAQARSAAILAEATARQAAITQEATTRQTADLSLASQITTVTASLGSLDAALQQEITARVNGDSAEASQRTTLAAQLRGSYTGTDVTQLTSGLVYSERIARATADGALASRADALEATVNNPTTGLVATRATLVNDYYTAAQTNSAIASATTNLVSQSQLNNYVTSATLTSNYYTKTQTDSAISQSSTTLTASFNNTLTGYATTAAVQQNYFAKADGQSLQGQYTVKIDLNGHVTGFGLASTVVNGTPTSAFIVRADKFAIVDPASTANNLTNSPSADTVPFSVVGGAVYIKSAFIQDASISSAKIGDLAANKITAGNINAAIGIRSGNIYGAHLYAGGTTTINGDGSFTANNPTFKVESGNVEIVSANFKIKTLATATTTFTPFQVVGGIVYMDTAFIRDGTITTAQIQNAQINNAQIVSLSADKITTGTLDAGLITIDGVTLDTYYDSGIGRNRLRIKDLAITTAKISDAQITTSKITDLAVSTIKIAGNAVTQPQVYTASDLYVDQAIYNTSSGVSTSYSYVGMGNGDYIYTSYFDPWYGTTYDYYEYVGVGNGDFVAVTTYGSPTFTGASTAIETPTVTVGVDSTAAVQIVYYATLDAGTAVDAGQHLFMLLDTGVGYRLVAQTVVGSRTSSGNTYTSLPIAMTFTARNLVTARVKIVTGTRRVDLGAGTGSNPSWLRNSTISFMGAKR